MPSPRWWFTLQPTKRAGLMPDFDFSVLGTREHPTLGLDTFGDAPLDGAQFPLYLRDVDRGVGVNGHRHPGLGQWREALDRFVLCQLLLELCRRQAIGTAGLVEAGPTTEITNGINAGDAAHRIRMLGGPVVEHQPAAAAW